MLANYHTHTWRCRHARGTEQEYVEQAMKNGLKILGFSDHSPYFFPGDYYSDFRMRPEQLEEYVQTILALKQTYADRLEIHLGLELEYYPGLIGQLLPMLREQPLEYLLLGQHFAGDEMNEHYICVATDSEELLRRHCAQTMEVLNTGLFSCLAHPDIFNFTGDSHFYAQQMRHVCREANSCGVPLEINCLGIAAGRHYPNELFWQIAAEENCRAVLGLDAHRPESFGDADSERKAMELVQKYPVQLLDTLPLRAL